MAIRRVWGLRLVLSVGARGEHRLEGRLGQPGNVVSERLVHEVVGAQEGEIREQPVDGVLVRRDGHRLEQAPARILRGRVALGLVARGSRRRRALEHHPTLGPASLQPHDRIAIEVEDAALAQVAEALHEALRLEALDRVDLRAPVDHRVGVAADRRVFSESQAQLLAAGAEAHDPGAVAQSVLLGGLRIFELGLAGQLGETRRQAVGGEGVGRELERLRQDPALGAPFETRLLPFARPEGDGLDVLGLQLGEELLRALLRLAAALLPPDLVEVDERPERQGDQQQDPSRARIHAISSRCSDATTR
jgi:hypothetical protein